MKIKTIHRRTLNYKKYVKRKASTDDCINEITEPCKVFDQDGNLLCVYDMIGIDTTDLVSELKDVKYGETTRTGGLVTTSRIFGFQPRLERRQRAFCNQTSLANENPKVEGMLRKLASHITKKYMDTSPEVFENHKKLLDKVIDEWRMPDSLFTSGIINKNNALAYHFDAGNFKDVLSCMLVLREEMEGGWLCVPEIQTRFLLKHNSLFMFDGQKILHGVSPMNKMSEDAYRFSIVYYSLKGMWKCLTLTEELARAREIEMAKLNQ
jgi:hypothetical protein